MMLKVPAQFATDEEKSAYRRGFNDFAPCDQTIFNPFDGEAEPELYDAWEAGAEAAANGGLIELE